MHEENRKSSSKESNSANEPLSLKVDSKKKVDEITKDIETIDFSNLVDQRKIIKRVENYGVETLNMAEQRSKNLSSMISKMTTNSTTDNQLDVNLEKLEKEIRTLDPSGVDFSKVVNGIQKLFSPITKYFNKLEQEDEKIEDIISSLNVGRNILSNDNITLELEIDKISDTIQMLELEHDVGTKIKNKIQSIVDEAKANNEDVNKIRFYEDEVIIPIEKRLFDIKQVIIVNQQSAMAMEIIRRNNKELIRNVDRIKNVTWVAVNTAVMVAKSLYNQKVILKKINGLNDSNNKLISYTSNRLSSEAGEIAKEISKNDISIQGLKNAFENAYKTFEEVSIDNKESNKKLNEELLEIKVKE